MASKKKKRREINPPEVIPSSSKDTNDYHESFDHPSWDNERKWAEEMMDSITRHGLNYALDKLTSKWGRKLLLSCSSTANEQKKTFS